MPYAPFYRLYIDNNDKRNISELVESFRFEDSIKEDSMLRITIRQEHAEAVADDRDFTTGTIIAFQFGFIAGKMSHIHRARVTDIKVKYRDRITMEVVCLDMGTVLKKVPQQKIYKKMTSVQIAQEVATKYGLKLDADATNKVWDNMPQGNKSDMEILKYLANREDGGNWVVYIRDDTLYFKQRGTEKYSLLTFTWGDGNGEVLSFEPTLTESGASGDMNKTVKAQFDPYTGKYKAEIVDKDTESGTGTLGSYKQEYNENEDSKTAKPAAAPKTATNAPQATFDGNKSYAGTGSWTAAGHDDRPAEDNKEAINHGNTLKKKATMKSLTAKLVVNGHPYLAPNEVITINNVARRFVGNWLIAKVTHDISMSGYLTTLDLTKNGTKQKNSTPAKDANNTKGPEKTENKVKIPQATFDGNKSHAAK